MSKGLALLPSGGLRYHARALAHRAAWGPFVARLGLFLRQDWAPEPGRGLLIVGSSAGWCLPFDALVALGFAEIIAVDLDPLALWILRRRWAAAAPNVPLTAVVADGLGVCDTPPGAALASLLARWPRAHVLFTNVWGQQVFQVDDPAARTAWKAALPPLLLSRSWASFFDRLSGPALPLVESGNERSLRGLEPDVLVERFYGHIHGRATPLALVDHETGDLFPERPRLHLPWALRPGQFHLIEAVCGKRDGGTRDSGDYDGGDGRHQGAAAGSFVTSPGAAGLRA